uniref:protein jagged-2-like n=1 Tax=Gasterosteus aculeatus aculeatus TaxID=481459 RepID=UPI001A99BECB|nr:protein jagged-2-like [Gasterosteus aculeatus aculeatus]
MWNNPGKVRRGALVCLLLALCAEVSRSTGYFELQLMSVGNPAGQLLNGDCCDAERSASEGSCGPDECDTYFRVCLKEYQTEVTTNGACTYGSETTKVLGGNTFQFRGGQKSGQNRNSDAGRILIPFQFAWPVSGRRRARAAAAGARAPGSRRRCVQGHGHQLEKCNSFGAIAAYLYRGGGHRFDSRNS